MSVQWLYASERGVPAGDGWLTPREREWSQRFRFSKRRDDYRLGRWVAKRAVARALSLPADDPDALSLVDVRNKREGAERGAPEVFVGGQPAPLGISVRKASDKGGPPAPAKRGRYRAAIAPATASGSPARSA